MLFRGALIVLTSVILWAGAVAARAADVTFRDDHVVLVGGKPFFPIGLYYNQEAFEDTSNARLAEIRAYGFNTLNYFKGYAIDRAEWDRAHQLGFMIWTRGYNGLAIGSDAAAAALTQQVQAGKDHPALLFWEFEDEPLLNKVDAGQARRGQAILKQLDSKHPTLIVEWPSAVERMAEWKDLGDIYAADLYPIPRERGYGKLPNKDITQLRDYLGVMRQARGDKPLMLVLQAWNWEPLKYGEHGYPTPAESRFMAYQSVIHGAKALFYYGQMHCTRPNSASSLFSAATDPATQQAEFAKCLELNRGFWERHRPFFQELGEAARIFALRDAKGPAGVKLSTTASGGPIELLTKQHGSELYVLAVNASDKPARAMFQRPVGNKSQKMHVLFEKRQITLHDGGWADDFKPYGVHVYSTTADLPPK